MESFYRNVYTLYDLDFFIRNVKPFTTKKQMESFYGNVYPLYDIFCYHEGWKLDYKNLLPLINLIQFLLE